MSKRGNLERDLALLAGRVARLERERWERNHEHQWRYSKHLQPTDHWFWSWRCVDEECGVQGGASTYEQARLADVGFPESLR